MVVAVELAAESDRPTLPRVEPGHLYGNRYRPVDQVGRRPWGYAFRAVDERTGATVTLFDLRPDAGALAPERATRAAIEPILAAVAALDHAEAVRPLAGGGDGASVYAVEEWVEGPTLDEVVADGPLATERAFTIALDVLDALLVAHGAGVTHGGLTAADVHLDGGADGPARVGGFGIAGALGLAPADPEAADARAVGQLLALMLPAEWPSEVDAVAERLARGDVGTVTEARALLRPLVGELPPVAVGELDEPPLPSVRRSRGVVVALAVLATMAVAGVTLLVAGALGRSEPSESVEVPDVKGRPQEVAETALDGSGLDVRIEVQRSAEVDRGAVVTQEPAAGANAREGDTVTLVVSTGAGDVVIPSVVGMDQATAEATLREAGFEVGVEAVVRGDLPAGQVIEQRPSADNRAERGTEVVLLVARPGDG